MENKNLDSLKPKLKTRSCILLLHTSYYIFIHTEEVLQYDC